MALHTTQNVLASSEQQKQQLSSSSSKKEEEREVEEKCLHVFKRIWRCEDDRDRPTTNICNERESSWKRDFSIAKWNAYKQV